MRADAFTLVTSAMGLCRIFDHHNAVLPREGQDRIHIRGLPEQMHWQKHFGLRRDCGGDPRRVNVMGRGIRFDRYWRGSDCRNGQPCGNISVGRHDHLIARTNIESAQR